MGICLAACVVLRSVPSPHDLAVEATSASPQKLPRAFSTSAWRKASRGKSSSIPQSSNFCGARGGDSWADSHDGDDKAPDSENADEERYSRQVYTLGARAHGLVRASTVYVDGPLQSGLLWESLKNLALSGVGSLVVLVDDDRQDCDVGDDDGGGNTGTANAYHNAILDDLGKTYIHGARAELGLDGAGWGDSDASKRTLLAELLVEFLFRLNPALQVSTMLKTEFLEQQQQQQRNNHGGDDAINSRVLLCIDRPSDTQLHLNEQCRSSVAFVAVETCGVYGRVFCDFGPKHEIYDGDGETPLVVPLDRVQIAEDDSGEVEVNDSSTCNSMTLLVKCVEGERHDVSKGDIIQFQRSDGSFMEEVPCKVTKVESPERINVQLVATTAASSSSGPSSKKMEEIIRQINQQAASFSRHKQVEEINFVSLEEALQHSVQPETGSQVFTPCDLDKSFDETRRKAIFGCFQTLNAFVKENGRLPQANDLDSFSATDLTPGGNFKRDESDEWTRHCRNFVNTCQAKFVPLQAIFGAIASQECLKAVSGLYNPINQFLLYDCDEVLPLQNESSKRVDAAACASGLSYILGEDTEGRLRNQKLFVVGSGAIGCEILKNLAAMGAATGTEGAVVVTDMDTIEKSNLSRQLLFRDSDIGKFKSKAAVEAVHRLNPSVRMEYHTSKVGEDDDPGPFDSEFWSKGVDVVLNALDNMDARLFMDSQCVANGKALVDAGTLGSKGNVQVVVPFKSESYGSSADPPDPAIPVCTLKNFPYAISHTIQWGRDLFDGLFVRRPRQVNQYAGLLAQNTIDDFASKLEHDLGDQAAIEAAIELSEDVIVLVTSTTTNEQEASMKEQAISWAIGLAKKLFCDSIHELLIEHPIDSVDEDGGNFWSGSRKAPKALTFSAHGDRNIVGDQTLSQQDMINRNLIDFVRSAARLRYETYMGTPTNAQDNLHLVKSEIAEERLANLAGGWNRVDNIERGNSQLVSDESIPDAIQRVLAPLKSFSALPERQLSAVEFEKDDESNDHIAFIAAASNLRAICYGIPPVTAMETRKIAGKIVPAMITTTAFVSALSCIELIKLVQPETPLRRHRNAFINLALPFFAFTSPLPAEEFPGVRGATHTLWDRIDVQEGKKAAQRGGLTLRNLLKRIQKRAHEADPGAVQVSSISVGPYMVYANFLHEDDDELLDTSIWRVIQEAVVSGDQFDEDFSRGEVGQDGETHPSPKSSSTRPPSEYSAIDLTVVVEDTETGEEIELPPVRVRRSTTSTS